MQAYKIDPIFIEQLEQQFMAFLREGPKSSRLALQPLAKVQRALVHEYAEAGWGFVSHSVGSEPHRVVQVFKTPSSGEDELQEFFFCFVALVDFNTMLFAC